MEAIAETMRFSIHDARYAFSQVFFVARPELMTSQSDSLTKISLRVQPGASRNAVTFDSENRVRIALTSPPIDGKANQALIKFLSKALQIPKRRISIVTGEKSRDKIVSIEGLSEKNIRERLSV